MSPIRPENRDRYPANWRLIRARILHRAAGQCECMGECGSCLDHRVHPKPRRCAERGGRPANTFNGPVILTIAHLDHQPEHNEFSNLRAYCQLCHLAYDREHHARMRRLNRDRDTGQGSLFS
jgi:5-methylcytosine-specific restriction endonuclease McrA